MSYQNRLALVMALRNALGVPVLSYVTADRPSGFGAQVGNDVIRLLKRHLDAVGDVEELALFLYTRGGDTMVPLRLVALLREYAKRLTLVVPFRAHSAGTLIALGCDRILMHRMGELSPIDPSVTNPFNPPNSQQAGALIPIGVEDVTAYLALVHEKAKIEDPQGVSAAFQALTNVVHPLALGNVQRSHLLIRRVARLLLQTHTGVPEAARDKVVDVLTEKLHAHQYAFGRSEAKSEVGLPVELPSSFQEQGMWSLYEAYESDFLIGQSFDPMSARQADGSFKTLVAAMETSTTADEYEISGIVNQVGPGLPPTVELRSQAWIRRV